VNDVSECPICGCGAAGRAVTMIDVNPASFVLAKRYFDLPNGVVCRVADATSFLRSDTLRYDTIVLDAFHGDRIPAHLRSNRFFWLVHDHLTNHGVLFANIHIKHNLDDLADRIADCIANVFPDVRILDSKGFPERNAIAMAGAVSNLRPPCVLVPPAAEVNAINTELAAMKFRTRRAMR